VRNGSALSLRGGGSWFWEDRCRVRGALAIAWWADPVCLAARAALPRCAGAAGASEGGGGKGGEEAFRRPGLAARDGSCGSGSFW